MLEKLFKLSANKTDAKTEVLGRYHHLHDNGVYPGS